MIITFPKDEFLYQLFPELAGIDLSDEAELEKALRRVSSYAGYTPRIRVEKGLIVIELDEEKARTVNEQHRRIVQLAEKGQLAQARKLLIPRWKPGRKIPISTASSASI